MASVGIKYTVAVSAEHNLLPSEDVKIIGWDKNATEVINKTTDSTGNISNTELQKCRYVTPGMAEVTSNPHRLRACLYGKKIFTAIRNVVQASAETFYLETHPFITESNIVTTASLSSSIGVNHSTGVITITGSITIYQLFDYLHYLDCTAPQFSISKIMTTIDGTTYSTTYDIVVNNASLTGTGKKLDLGVAEFSMTNGGSTNMQVTDVNGTQVALTINVNVTGYEIRIYNKSSTEGIIGTDLVGEENWLSSIYNYNYNHTADKEVGIQIIKDGYIEYLNYFTLTINPLTINITLKQDLNI